MLGCCNSYGRGGHPAAGMEKTEMLEIKRDHNRVKRSLEIPLVENRKETPLETIDNKELEEKQRRTKIGEKVDEDREKNDASKEEDGKTEDRGSEDADSRGSEGVVVVKMNDASAESEDVSYSEDNSVDNNTFNIINTENSESQEISELTNDESHKENAGGDQVRENGESDRGTQTDEDSDDELSCLDEEEEEDECEMTDDSGDSDVDDLTSGSDDGDESDDEREFDHDSLEEDKDKTLQHVLPIVPKLNISLPTVPPLPLAPPVAPAPVPVTHAAANSSVAAVKTCEPKPESPRVRQRLRSFGKKDNNDFKIEIYESKRKPAEIPAIKVPQDTQKTDGGSQSKTESAPAGKDAPIGQTSTDKCNDKPAPQADYSPCSDITTPDSTDNTLGLTLDVSQAIREETDESDRFSPLRSPMNDKKETAKQPGKDTDTKAAIITSSSSSPAAIEQVSTVTSSSSTSTTVSSSSTSDQQQQHQQHQHQQQPGGGESAGSPRDGLREVSPTDTKKPTPMAFTIELGGGTSASDLASTKKLDITASISKWAPKHRRNLSLTKVEEHKKVEERGGKPPVGRPRSGTIGATGLQQGRRGGGYHSEGYFSSDQDDEGPRRTELKSPRSPRTPELRSPQTPQRLVRSTSQDSAKGASLRKQTGKTEGRACCKVDKKPTVAEVTGKAKSEKGSKQNTVKMTPEGRKQSNSANSLSSCQTYDVKQDAESEGGKEEKDDVSEAGTYTIEKDSSSPEVEQARSDIDRVFGVSGTESEVDVTVVTPRGNATTEELWTPTPEKDKFKSPGSISRSSPNWIRQWAAQVAEHTKSSDVSVKTSLGSPRGSKPPLASLSSSQESSESRPRRKLPTPPTHHPPYTMVSPKASDLSDHESPTKGQQHRQLLDSLILGKHQSDYRRDTESFLRDTEQLVTSLQARVDMNKGISPGLRGTSFESHDSGGDSDLDTSTSYPINDDDDRLMKTIGSQLKTRLKLAGIDGTSKTPPAATIPRKPDPLPVETRIKLTSHFKRERSIVSDSGLRRARLASEEATQQHKSPSPVDKKKIARPSSAGNLSGSRKIPLSQSKSHQGGHALSRSGSHSQATTPKSGSNDFSRGDGGRFSLRLPNSVSSTTVSKSPSRTSVKKELSGSRRGAPRSNSTLSAKEVDFQNWKRRKNYDPMKAAAEGRKKPGDKKSDKLSQGNTHSTNERSPSPPVSLLRSASFHGTEGMGVAGRWPRRPNHLYTSEDDGPCSLEEEQPHPVPHCSPLRRSPTSPHQLSSPHTTSPARQATLSSARARRASYALSDEGEGHVGSPRKTSLDESGSEGKRSPLGSTRGIVSGRSKAKMEALDNLVISTIHSLSVKVRTTSETLLQKLKSQYDEEGDRAALLEEVLAHLSESDQTLTSGQSRSTSRELAGILRNLKKIEHALEVIDRVMVCVDDDDLDEDDLDGTTGHDWGGSDY